MYTSCERLTPEVAPSPACLPNGVVSLTRNPQRLVPKESLVIIYRSIERLSRPYPARDLRPGSVAWKRDIPLGHWA
ncbi:hypothetical protein TNCV_4551851 [Trichonephila clavipes]|nr:hypothetical protein TNCV_4551851 [Trichonephila clavipes]